MWWLFLRLLSSCVLFFFFLFKMVTHTSNRPNMRVFVNFASINIVYYSFFMVVVPVLRCNDSHFAVLFCFFLALFKKNVSNSTYFSNRMHLFILSLYLCHNNLKCNRPFNGISSRVSNNDIKYYVSFVQTVAISYTQETHAPKACYWTVVTT